MAASRSGIGVRMALGAAPTRIFRMVASRAAALTAAGAALGSVGWMAMQSAMRSVAFGVSPSDTGILSLAVAVMFATAVAACWFPARRAMRVDPVAALREE